MSISKDQVENIYPLSPMQEALLYRSLLEPESTVYSVQISFLLEGSLNPEWLLDDLRFLTSRHPILRTVFVNDNTAQPLQVVLKDRLLQAAIEDALHVPAGKRVEFIRTRKTEDQQEPFVLSKGPLHRVRIIRFDANVHAVIWSYHHILLDGWSLAILLDELHELQRQRQAGQTRGLPARPFFNRYIQWIARQDSRASIEYWRGYLAGYDGEADLLRSVAQTSTEAASTEYRWTLGEALSGRLRAFAQEYGLTMNTVLQTLWGIILAKSNDCRDVVFGATVSGRPPDIPEVENMVGLFINTLPVRLRFENESFLELARAAQRSASEAQSHQYCSLAEIQSISGQLRFDHLFVFENFPFTQRASDALADFEVWEQTDFDLTVTVNPVQDVQFRFAYAGGKVDLQGLKSIETRFKQLAGAALSNSGAPVAGLEIITDEERRLILSVWNSTATPFPEEQTLVSLFEQRASEHPGRPAILFRDRILSYGDVDARSDAVRSVLRTKGAGPGSRVGVFAYRSEEMIIALLGIFKAAAAYVPLDPDYPQDRLAFMLRDSGIRHVLTNVDSANFEFAAGLADVISLSDIAAEEGLSLEPENGPGPTDPAYVIYTSGSTGRPKGVEIEHRSVVNRLHWMQQVYPIGPQHVILQKTPFTFDVSVWELFLWFFGGASLCFLEPGDERDPERIVETIRRRRVTTMHFVPTMLGVFLDYVEENRVQSDLATLERVFASGEAIELACVHKFNALLFAANRTQLINMYGPTEASIEVSFFDCSPTAREPLGSRVPIGKPIHNSKLYVLSAERKLQPVGVPGELAIGGVPVGRGYLNRPGLTKKRFVADPFSLGARIYMTGDVCRWRADGNVEFLGRKDHQIKLRGLRIETEEVVQCIQQYPGILQAVVTLRKTDAADAALCAYFVARTPISSDELRAFLASRLPQYMLPSWFCPIEKFPQTSSGKIDRNALPLPVSGGHGDATRRPPRDRIESLLADIWKQILKVDEVGIDDGFFALGGHSLKAIRLISAIHRAFAVRVSVKNVFLNPTLAGMADLIRRQTPNASVEVSPARPAEFYPLSSQQRRQYLLREYSGVDKAYNLVLAFRVSSRIDPQRAESALAALISRHESLRTCFRTVEGRPMQKILSPRDAVAGFRARRGLRVEEVSEGQVLSRLRRSPEPFELEEAPLLRALIFQDANESGLFIELHHIISDDMSNDILMREFLAAYRGVPLPPVNLQYKDYAVWQNDLMSGDAYRQHESWWLEHFSGGAPVLEMPLDSPRPKLQSFEGSGIALHLDTGISSQVHALAKGTGVTPFAVLLACFKILLARCSGQEDVVAGVPVSGRMQADLEHVVGMFANTIALRTFPKRDGSCRDFLRHTHQRFLEALEHEIYPFEALVERLGFVRDPSRNPVFDVMFVYRERSVFPGSPAEESGGLIPCDIDVSTSQFDITLEATNSAGGFDLQFVYASRLFERATIESLARRYEHVLRQIVTTPEMTVGALTLITPAERAWIEGLNDTAVPFPSSSTLVDVFEERVRLAPSARAIVFDGEAWSYERLNQAANGIAHCLISDYGIGAEEPVAIMAQRSHWMVAGIFGILKAGSPYVPIDPEFPPDRVRHILADSGCRVLLTDAPNRSDRSDREIPGTLAVIRNMASSRPDNPPKRITANHLAAILYTSGSTGRPKGVMLEHQGLVNRIHWLNRKTELNSDDVLLLKTPFTFDVSMSELFWWTFAGASLAILKPGDEKDPQAIAHAVATHKVTSIHFVASMLTLFLEAIDVTVHRDQLTSLRLLFTSGEAVRREHVAGVQDKGGPSLRAFYNLYGPTEASIEVSAFDCLQPFRGDGVPIGTPIDNLKLYVIDPVTGQMQPPGIPGEICICGQGLARGYWNRPDLTAERFVVNSAATPERMYRTGDLGRWNTAGVLEYWGRSDFQVKIRGYRIELGEIESVLAEHPAISQVVVAAQPSQGSIPFLAAYYVSRTEVQAAELKSHLARSLPAYMVPAVFIRMEAIPLNSNGKVDRKSLPSTQSSNLDKTSRPEIVSARNSVEARLLRLWKEVLGREDIGIHDEFLEAGGHSLFAARLNVAIFKEFSIQLPLRNIFLNSTVARQARDLESNGYSVTPIPTAERQETYALSPAQSRLWLVQQLEAGSGAYNLTVAVVVEGPLDVEALDRAVGVLATKHEALRTVFVVTEIGPRQKILPESSIRMTRIDMRDDPGKAAAAEKMLERQANQVLDLAAGPLFQATLIRIDAGVHWLGLTMHHLISDGGSIRLLIADLVELYETIRNGGVPDLSPARIQYKDFAEWQSRRLQGDYLEGLLEYWKGRLGAGLPPLKMPVDYMWARTSGSRGATRHFPMDAELSARLRVATKEMGVTPFQFLLAVYFVLLSRWCSQRVITVGTSSEGREHPDLTRVAGFFVNTLAVKCDVADDISFRAFLKSVQRDLLRDMEHQELPFDLLLQHLAIPRTEGTHPVFQVRLVYHAFDLMPGHAIAAEGIRITNREIPFGFTKFDLSTNVVASKTGDDFYIEYRTDRFSPATIARLVNSFQLMLGSALDNPDQPLHQFRMESGERGSAAAASSKLHDLQRTPVNPVTVSHHVEED